MDFESLGRVRLLGPGDIGRSDLSDAERTQGIAKAGAAEDLEDDVLQAINAESAGIEVQVFGISDALEEKTQVRAAFNGECLGLNFAGEAPEEFQMKNLPKLERRKNTIVHISIIV
jgi:hypothetical protein